MSIEKVQEEKVPEKYRVITLVEEGKKPRYILQVRRPVVLRHIMSENIVEYYRHEIRRVLGIEGNYPL